MGANNVTTLLRVWPGHLSHAQMRAAIHMAVHALDGHDPPLYYGGWEAVAHALGRWTPGADPASVRRQTQRVITDLARAGVITSSGQARPRVRAEYALNLDPRYRFEPAGHGREVTWRRVPRADPRPVEARPTRRMGDSERPALGDSERPALGDSERPPQEALQEERQEGLGPLRPPPNHEHAPAHRTPSDRHAQLAALITNLPAA